MAEITDKIKARDIPSPTPIQRAQLSKGFIDKYGISWKDMRKEQLALMVANQSTNYRKIEEQANYIARLGNMYMNRWKSLVKIVRRDHYD